MADENESARHRPAEKRNEGRRRRRRGPKPVEATEAEGVVPMTDNASDAVESESPVTAEAEAPTAGSPVPDSSTQDSDATVAQAPDMSEAPIEPESEAISTLAPTVALDAEAQTEDAAEPASEPMVSEAVIDSTPTVAAVETVPDPEPAPSNTDGLTATGRAVNDPRVEPKPVGEVTVMTLRAALFGEQEAPPVSVVDRNVPRASNDPRGPKPGLSLAGTPSSAERNEVDTQDAAPEVQDASASQG